MKAMILAAGKGERMRPLTLETPKPLLQAGGRALIEWHLAHLGEAGFNDIVINHAWLGERLEQALGDGRHYDLHIEWSPEGEPLETAGGIRQALPKLVDDGDDWFLVINGDIWTDFDLKRLEPMPDTDAILVLADNPPHHTEGDFHLTADGKVDDQNHPRLTYTGIALLHRRLLEDLPPGYRKLAPLLREAMAQGRVRGLHHRGHWFDIGTPERLEQLDGFLQSAEGPQ